jgi:hypothetical protein
MSAIAPVAATAPTRTIPTICARFMDNHRKIE